MKQKFEEAVLEKTMEKKVEKKERQAADGEAGWVREDRDQQERQFR